MFKNKFLIKATATTKLTLQTALLSLRTRSYTAQTHEAVSSVSPSVVSSEIQSMRSQQALNLDNPLVILPQPSPITKESEKLLPNLFSEYLAVLHACLKLGEIDRAKKILRALYVSSPSELIHHLDINVHNAFIEAFVDAPKPDLDSALHWLDYLDRFGLKPDVMTFSILIRGYLRLNCDWINLFTLFDYSNLFFDASHISNITSH